MKFIQKFPIESNISQIFANQFEIFDFKHRQENFFLDDIESFISKKCLIEEQCSKSIISLCESYMNKNYQIYDNKTILSVPVPDHWKAVLETVISISEKKMVSCASILLSCDIFSVIKEQKKASYQKVLDYMKKVKDELSFIQNEFIQAYRVYNTEILLSQNIKHSHSVEKDLKNSSIDLKTYSQILEYLKKSFEKPSRDRQIDLAKLNCLTIFDKLNKVTQHYFSSELPQLLQLQNGNMNLFIYEFLESIFKKENETNEYIVKMVNEFNKIDLSDTQNNPVLLENIVTFDYMVQFENNKKYPLDEQIKNPENVKYFAHEYDRLVTESKKLLTTIDEYAKNSNFFLEEILQIDESEIAKLPSLPEVKVPKFIMNENWENQKFLIMEKNSELKKLMAQIEYLEVFRINNFMSNNLAFTVQEIAHLNGHLDNMLKLESRFYSETLMKTVNKPFIEPEY
ncbi:hypothetical protein BpHYR1_037630 [Brachionus plicatilis]|uniref:Uncharacterized protein n=1 Tax=Brachionus plicatilis TaxID=10195 RepID=A0A3M7RYD5_BRAPC|nr:hypothetical protein BpHYR1_037630 [Brachionus plicatilis]